MEIRTESVTLTAASGLMPCHLARPGAGGPHPGVIVVMEAFGLNAHIKAVAERVAREGYVSIAPDLYHRFGSPVIAYDAVPKAIELLQKLDDGKVMGEIGVAIAHLKRQPDVRPDRIGIAGFCMGGRIAFLAAAHHAAEIKAAVPFYGGGIAADTPTAPINVADRITAPVLAFFGEQDPLIPLDQVKRLEETMRRLGKAYEARVYAGAGHGFFCDERASYHAEAARDAWDRLTRWLARYLKAG